MRERRFYAKLIFARVIVGFLFCVSAQAQPATVKTVRNLSLGETAVKINVYEKKGSQITFIAPHHNEQTGLKIARELIEKKGGRLVEIESVDENGNPSRQLKFKQQGKTYSVDPNRIYTENGRNCPGVSPEINAAIKTFAANFLKIILSADGSTLRDGEKFLVAVHNNSDIDDAGKSAAAKENDLTAFAFVKYNKASQLLHGKFQAQADGAYLSNVERDEDNFFFLSTPAFVSFFAEKGFNAVVQKSAAKLQTKDCGIDDGSLSVFAGQRDIPYINVEADAVNGGVRQRQMLEAVYELSQKTNQSEPKSGTAAGYEKGKADRRR